MPGRIRLLILCFVASCSRADARAQFTGAFADGTRFQMARLAGWPESAGTTAREGVVPASAPATSARSSMPRTR